MNLVRTILISVVVFLSSIFVYSQDINHWESVVLSNNSSRYFPGNSAPDSNWQLGSFDDTSWSIGKASVGYGDGDDLTEISSVLSVYMRVEFNVVDLSNIVAAVLHMDYDDAFVAYLNGIEIARSNIGTIGTEPSYNERASRDHEALLYTGGTPESFPISNAKLAATLKQGANVLAIQVHNVTANSSDMTCMPFLSLGISNDSNNYSSTPAWFTAPPEEFTASKLPILIIDTEGGVAITDEPKVNANLNIAYNDTGGVNYLVGPYHESSGPIGIEVRGNATQDFPKKAYVFETRDSLGNNRNVKILGLPEENDWILRACYLDKTLIRNAIACQMSRNMGRYASRFSFCEVVLNGSYQGVYMLMEKIKRDKNRVDIEKLSSDLTDPDSIKGGYIYEVSQSTSDLGERRSLVYPDPDDANTAQIDYIKNYDDQFRAIMEKSNYADAKSGYPLWIDVQSFIDEIIVQEACKNSDAYGWSSYFHKKRYQKLAAGPIWDFDQALSNSTWNDGNNPNEWIITKGGESIPTFWAKLFNEPTFKYLFKKRWFELRESTFHTDTLMNMVDGFAQQLDGAQQRNFERWPLLGTQLWRSLPGWADRDTYEKEVNYMKEWFVAHLAWMDQQLALVPDQKIEIPELIISEIMYSAFHGTDQEYLKVENAGDTPVDLTGIFFSDGIEYSFNTGETIQPGEHVIIASDTIVFREKHGTAAYDKFIGQLQNKGENIEISNSFGVTIDQVNYSDTLPWPVSDMYNTGAIALVDLSSDNNVGTNWEFVEAPKEVPNLVISEIMYAPAEGSDFEFIEIVNADDKSVDLTGVFLSEAIDYTFPDGYKLPSGKSVVVASDTTLFKAKYGFSVFGEFNGKLDNNGEEIMLQNNEGSIIDLVNYNNKEPWPLVNMDNPRSIELIDSYSDNALPENWELSSDTMGTPVHYNPIVNNTIHSIRNGINVYPKPAKDILNIDFYNLNGDEVLVEIYDIMGSLKFDKRCSISHVNSIAIDVNHFVNGSYIVKVTSVDARYVDKIVIRK